MSKDLSLPYKGKTVLGTEWRTTTTRSDNNINYKYTALLPRVQKPYEGRYGKTWELKAPHRSAKWKKMMGQVDWPSEDEHDTAVSLKAQCRPNCHNFQLQV